MSNSTRRNLMISIAIFLAAALAFGYMVFRIVQQENLLKDQIATIEKERLQQDSYNQLLRTAEESKEDRAQLTNLFLSRESDSIEVLNRIEALAPQLGLSLEIRNLVAVKEADEHWVEISLDFEGTEEGVKQFLKILENLEYVSYLSSVDLSESNGKWEALTTIRIRVYENVS